MYDEIIQKLADMFFVSVEYVQAHFWEYVLMYGKYHLVDNLGGMFCDMVMSCLCGGLLGLVFFYLFTGEDFPTKEQAIKIILPSIVIACVLVLIAYFAPYLIAPEMYSLEAVMRLMNGG